MNADVRHQLRAAAVAAMRVPQRDASGPFAITRKEPRWALQTSNSFRRIGCHGDGDVLCATTQRPDGQPDLLAAAGVLDYIVATQPQVLLDLLDYVDALEAEGSR